MSYDFNTLADVPVPHEDGSLVSGRISRVVEAIRDYDRSIDVQWIPPRARESGDAAFRLIHTNPGGQPYVMFLVQTEDEFDERVLAKIYYNDTTKHRSDYDMIQAHDRATKELEKRRFMDIMEQQEDIAAHVLKSPLNWYRVDDNLTIRDYGNASK
jgi:hypothetical protein